MSLHFHRRAHTHTQREKRIIIRYSEIDIWGSVLCRRVVRPWIGLKMLDLNDMIVAQLKERDPAFPAVSKGVLVPVVCPIVLYYTWYPILHEYINFFPPTYKIYAIQGYF